MKIIRWLLVLVAAVALMGAPQKSAKGGKKAPAATSTDTSTKSKPLDINSASRDELDALPGIGKVYSQKIIDGRPYANKRQLVSKGILPQSVYDKISGNIIAKQATAKANTAAKPKTK